MFVPASHVPGKINGLRAADHASHVVCKALGEVLKT